MICFINRWVIYRLFLLILYLYSTNLLFERTDPLMQLIGDLPYLLNLNLLLLDLRFYKLVGNNCHIFPILNHKLDIDFNHALDLLNFGLYLYPNLFYPTAGFPLLASDPVHACLQLVGDLHELIIVLLWLLQLGLRSRAHWYWWQTDCLFLFWLTWERVGYE